MKRNSIPGAPEWKSSTYICALCDSERHIGHVVKINRWHAYDATKLNDAADGFCCIGGFDDVDEAKRAVEKSVMEGPRQRTLRAVAAGSTVWGA